MKKRQSGVDDEETTREAHGAGDAPAEQDETKQSAHEKRDQRLLGAGRDRLHERQAAKASGHKREHADQRQRQEPRRQRQKERGGEWLRLEDRRVKKPVDPGSDGRDQHNPKAMAPPTEQPKRSADRRR